MENIVEKTIVLNNTNGLHASLASKLVHMSSRYDALVRLVYKDQVVDAKSILGLMSLAIPYGDNVEVHVVGPDAETVLEEIEKLLG
jgi:phosphocarrier protein